jgi:1-acyl-sn-glycerol-3-phosphate acyltransferase
VLRLLGSLFYLVLIIIVVPIMFSPLLRPLAKRREIASFLYRKFYQALNVQLIIKGMPTAAPALWICNHISWLDILLLAGSHTVDFIAKIEVGKWPVIGAVVKKTGTILIHRENKFQTYRSLPKLQNRLRSGSSIIVFPEGTTTTGLSTLPFKPMLYQAAIREKAMIQPIALQYFDAEGEITEAAAFVGEDSFVNSFKRIIKQPRITVVMHFLPALPASEYHRKQLADLNQISINNTLMLQASKVDFEETNLILKID